MLAKLLKHDIKKTSRSLGVYYGILLLLAIGTRLLEWLSSIFKPVGSLYALIIFAFVLALIGIFFYTFALSIISFYKEFIKDEGYLMHTLPVSKNQLVGSKLLTAIIAMIVTFVLSISALGIAFYTPHCLDEVIATLQTLIQKQLGVSFELVMIGFLLYMLLSYVYQILFFYLSIALGQTRSANKLMYSVVFGIALNVVIQIIMTLMLLAISLFEPAVLGSELTVEAFGWVMIPSTIMTLALAVAFFFATGYIFKRKLNME